MLGRRDDDDVWWWCFLAASSFLLRLLYVLSYLRSMSNCWTKGGCSERASTISKLISGCNNGLGNAANKGGGWKERTKVFFSIAFGDWNGIPIKWSMYTISVCSLAIRAATAAKAGALSINISRCRRPDIHQPNRPTTGTRSFIG